MSDTKRRAGMRPGTAGIHAGPPPDEAERAARSVVTPIYQTTTFRFDSIAEMAEYARGGGDRFLYTRYEHPNFDAVESRMAAMEGTEAAVSFASGMAAIAAAVLAFCSKGDSVVAFREIYGGTHRLLTDLMPRFGVAARLVPTGDFDALRNAIDTTTRLVIAETPTNPLARVVDLDLLGAVGRETGVPTMLDNTFATPVNQRPARHGVDLVMHSATKYLGGHSDVMGGFVCGSAAHVDAIRTIRRVTGGILDPHAAFLLERGMKSIGPRVARHNENALAVARLLTDHPAVGRVFYPGLECDAGHAVAMRQMSGFGGMLAFDLNGGLAAAEKFCAALRVGTLAVSLGAVETLVSVPALTSHVMLSETEREELGIREGTLRFSVGIEEPEDLLADVQQALDAAR